MASARLKPRQLHREHAPFALRCPYCNSEVEVQERDRRELICQCGAGTENGKWREGYL